MEPHGNVSGTFSVQSRSLRRMHSIFNLYWTIHCFCAMGVASTTAGTRTIDSYTLRSRMDIRSSVVDPSGARQWDERYFKSDDYGFNLVTLPTSVQWDKPKTGDIQLWRGPGKMGGVPPGREAGRGRKKNRAAFPPVGNPEKLHSIPPGDTQEKLHSIPPGGHPEQIAQHSPLGDTQKNCTAFPPGGHPEKMHSIPPCRTGNQFEQFAGVVNSRWQRGEHHWDQPLALSSWSAGGPPPEGTVHRTSRPEKTRGDLRRVLPLRRDEHHWDQPLASRPSEYDSDHPRREICRHTPRPKRRVVISAGFCRFPPRPKREASI